MDIRMISGDAPNMSHQLPVGATLREQYRVGRVLGQGGFGITYLGWDMDLEVKVAIKEYFPTGLVSRESSTTSCVTCTAEKELFQTGRDRFMREARTLARLREVPEIVHIYNLFRDNDTAYIVMEYIDGIDLREYIRSRGGKLTVSETFAVLGPVMEALVKVHEAGLVHRDISPDNIMLPERGGIKLLDFGTARNVEVSTAGQEMQHSTEAILKHGFAPLEQYQRRGSLGPWTDEYALCATVYYCLTGTVPPDALERLTEGAVLDWKSVPGLSPQRITALNRGMELRPRDRYPTLRALYEALYAGVDYPVTDGKMTQSPPAQIPVTMPLDPISDWKGNVLMKGSWGTPQDEAFRTGIPREKIWFVTILDTVKDAPADALDFSQGRDRSVLGWTVPSGAGYELFIAGEGGINAENVCRDLFSNFRDVRRIDFSPGFHTEGARDMRNMFCGCMSLTGLDLSGLCTREVRDMSWMLWNCPRLLNLQLGSWDTKKVTAFYGFMDEDKRYAGKSWSALFEK